MWSKFYSSGPEIQAYIKRTAAKYNLTKHVELDSRILEAIWNDEIGRWKIKIDVKGTYIKEDEADILVNAAGFLKSVNDGQMD